MTDTFRREAAATVSASAYPALIIESVSELIVAASPAATLLLDPSGGEVEGHRFEEFTVDRPVAGPDLFAGGRLNGFEAFRVLRRSDGEDRRIRMWIRAVDGQPPSKFVLIVMVADQIAPADSRTPDHPGSPAVFGTADVNLIIERISSDAEELFGCSVDALLGRSLVGLVAEGDVPNYLVALSEASATQNGVTLYLDVRRADVAAADTSATLSCEVLILPLHPSPSCAFVFLPAAGELSRAHVAADLSAILSRLGRGAEVSQLLRGPTAGLTDQKLPGLSRLTTRELEVLTRLLDGDRAPAIAAALFLSQGTVRNYLASIFSKVGVASQQQLLTLFRAARVSNN